MASKPWFDSRRKQWVMKWKPDPGSPWKRVVLGDAKDGRPTKKPPQWVLDRAAEFEEREFRARHRLGAGPSRDRPLSSFFDEYLDAFRVTRKKGSTRNAVRYAHNFMRFCEQRKVTTVQAVTQSVCRDYLVSRLKKTAASTVKSERGFLAGAFARAEQDGLVEVNPWSKAKMPVRVVKHEATFWSADEVQRIVDAATQPWQKDLVLVLANTGLRISAALEMRWSWIDFDRGILTVPASHSKGGSSYQIVLSRVATEVLELRHSERQGELVFPSRRRTATRISYSTAHDAVAAAIKRAGVKPGTIHDLRHTYGRALGTAGVPLPVIQRQLGHAQLQTTHRYTELNEEDAARWLKNFGMGEG